jgi:hypothetical protein
MKDWIWLIVPLLPLLIFLIRQIFIREEQPPPRRRQQPRPAQRPAAEQRGGGDLKRFLDEVRQLRERPTSSPKLGEPSPAFVAPVPDSKPIPEPQQRGQDSGLQTQRWQQLPSQQPVVLEIPSVLPADPLPAAPALKVQPLTLDPKAVPLPIRPVMAPKKVSAATRRLVSLLGSRDSLATAVLLKEVLDRPISMRPHR